RAPPPLRVIAKSPRGESWTPGLTTSISIKPRRSCRLTPPVGGEASLDVRDAGRGDDDHSDRHHLLSNTVVGEGVNLGWVAILEGHRHVVSEGHVYRGICSLSE